MLHVRRCQRSGLMKSGLITIGFLLVLINCSSQEIVVNPHAQNVAYARLNNRVFVVVQGTALFSVAIACLFLNKITLYAVTVKFGKQMSGDSPSLALTPPCVSNAFLEISPPRLIPISPSGTGSFLTSIPN